MASDGSGSGRSAHTANDRFSVVPPARTGRTRSVAFVCVPPQDIPQRHENVPKAVARRWAQNPAGFEQLALQTFIHAIDQGGPRSSEKAARLGVSDFEFLLAVSLGAPTQTTRLFSFYEGSRMRGDDPHSQPITA